MQLSVVSVSTAPLPISREHGMAVLWGITDMVQPATDLALAPGQVSPAQLGAAVASNAPGAAALRDAITAVGTLDQGYAQLVSAAHANLDAWIAALAIGDDRTPLDAGSLMSPASVWLRERVNVGLGAVIELASVVAPPPGA